MDVDWSHCLRTLSNPEESCSIGRRVAEMMDEMLNMDVDIESQGRIDQVYGA
jgi:hypothetical protein